MRKLVTNTFLTLDGLMQAPGQPEEDLSGGFTHGGWSAKYWDEHMNRWMAEFMGKPFDILLGRKTYEIFAAYWPHSDEPMASKLNNATKHVASHTLKRADWQPSRLITGDVAEGIARLKASTGPELQVYGSANLIQTLLRKELIDEFNLWFFPLVLGTGKRLFADGTIPAGLKLLDSSTSTTGVIISTFQPAGAIEYGTIGADAEASARR